MTRARALKESSSRTAHSAAGGRAPRPVRWVNEGSYWRLLDAEGKDVADRQRYTRPYTDTAARAACTHSMMTPGGPCAWCGGTA